MCNNKININNINMIRFFKKNYTAINTVQNKSQPSKMASFYISGLQNLEILLLVEIFLLNTVMVYDR